MAAQLEPRKYAPAKIQVELPNQPCALAWVGEALVAATYDYVEAEGTRVGGLCLLQKNAENIAATLEAEGGKEKVKEQRELLESLRGEQTKLNQYNRVSLKMWMHQVVI